MKQDTILILDLGNSENAGLARRVRALGVFSEIYAHDITAAEIAAMPTVKGIILNGGENNVIDGASIDARQDVYACGLPILARNHKAGGACALTCGADLSDAMLSDFIFRVCGCEANWNMANFIDDQVELLRAQIGGKRVLLALSGGVDSSVVAALLIKAVGGQLTCIHVNHGLLRKDEPEQVIRVFREQMNANLIYVDAVDRFLDKLAGVSDPEQKRKIIGAEFIDVFAEEAEKLDGIEFLGQGTIYPDIVESGTKTAKAIKAHHNVGGLPEKMNFKLVEPLKFLFKDEVRACGKELGLPDSMVYRQPFPGPGLGVRCLGAITRDRLEAVRASDAILREEFLNAGLEGKVWQYFTLIPDYRSTGIKNNARSFEFPVIIRAVNTDDAITASIEHIDWKVLDKITQRIITEVPGVNRVCYDLTPKPTGTIEWE